MILVQAGIGVENYWLVGLILLNSILTSIAGSRLWAHIFWRDGREGVNSEQINTKIRPLPQRAIVWGLLPTGALVASIVFVGLWPQPLFRAGGGAAYDVQAAQQYVGAVFQGIPESEGEGE